jgi:hypothetical protein
MIEQILGGHFEGKVKTFLEGKRLRKSDVVHLEPGSLQYVETAVAEPALLRHREGVGIEPLINTALRRRKIAVADAIRDSAEGVGV